MTATAADPLHADAVAVLGAWTAPDEDQDRLRRAYLEHLAWHADGLWRTCRPAHLTASALVVDADGARVLLTLHPKVGRWLQTGGHCEPADTTLSGAAAREAREESGIDGLVLLPDVMRLDRHAVRCGGAGPAEHLDVQFVALAPTGAVERISAESADLRWFPAGALPADTDDAVRRLVAAAAWTTSSEPGSPPPALSGWGTPPSGKGVPTRSE